MTVAFLVVALIADVVLSIIVYVLFKEVETLREHEQDTHLELMDLASKNRDSDIIQNTLKDNDDTCHKLYVKMENEVDDLEKKLKMEHNYFEIKYSGILGAVNNLWNHMDATEKVVLSLSEKASNTNTSEHKMKEPRYRYRHHYTYNSKPVRPISDIPEGEEEEVDEDDTNADSKEKQNTSEEAVYMINNNLSTALKTATKTAINSVYGLTSAKFDNYPSESENNAKVSKDNDSDIEQNTENDTATIEQTEDDDIPTFNDPSSIQK